MTGTMITTTSTDRTASVPSVVARKEPDAYASATASTSPGSSATCDRPSLIASTTAWLTSTAVTPQPCPANWAASGNPILPAPTRATDPTVPGSPVHGCTRRGV